MVLHACMHACFTPITQLLVNGLDLIQWRNRRGGGGMGRVSPQRIRTGKFLVTYREREARKKKENGAEKMQNAKKGRWKFFLLFSFHFSKPLKFVFCLPKWEISTGKKIRKNDFVPSEKYSSYAPDLITVWQTATCQVPCSSN